MDMEYLRNGDIQGDGAWGDCKAGKRGKQKSE